MYHIFVATDCPICSRDVDILASYLSQIFKHFFSNCMTASSYSHHTRYEKLSWCHAIFCTNWFSDPTLFPYMLMIVDPGKIHVMQTKYVDFIVYIQSPRALQMTKKVVVKANYTSEHIPPQPFNSLVVD